MPFKLADEFYFIDWDEIDGQAGEKTGDKEKYAKIINWAGKARGRNPEIFDALTGWMLDDSEWSAEKLPENERVLTRDIFARFKNQNAGLRAHLKKLEPADIVNPAVYRALDLFDEALDGAMRDEKTRGAIAAMRADFSVMSGRKVRELIAGQKTGPEGVNDVQIFGYVNHLKNLDAGVQWALFMPEAVKSQQKGFKLDSFEYKKMPAIRFIGREADDSTAGITGRKKLFEVLNEMPGFKSGFDFDILFMHHYGLCVDAGPWHGFWGRFMKEGAPVPDGFIHFDLTPQRDKNDFNAGPPFISQFAYAVFSGDDEAMHKREGFDSDAMYDVTRNIILGQGVMIPYPDKYWTAEVFTGGCDKHSRAYMFGVEIED